jgi:hypothetical protein
VKTQRSTVHRHDGSAFEVTETQHRGAEAEALIRQLQEAGWWAWDNYSGASIEDPETGELFHASRVAVAGLSAADVKHLLKLRRRS